MKNFLIFPLFFCIPFFLIAYESMQDKTPVGKIVIIDLPKRLALEAKTEGAYFDSDNGLFRKLFRYISNNDVSMTTPVEADINPGKMRFFVGKKDLSKNLMSNNYVDVITLPNRKAVSIGTRGGYSKKNFLENKNMLEVWLSKNKQFSQNGDAYAVYWNGPFVPGFFKRSEVHIPIIKAPKINKFLRK